MSVDLSAGLCVDYPDKELWFRAGSAKTSDVRKAVRICGNCPCRQACLDQVTEREVDPAWGAYGRREARIGIAGGLTPRQRTKLLKAGEKVPHSQGLLGTIETSGATPDMSPKPLLNTPSERSIHMQNISGAL